jgi:hypothetical protein
MVILEALIQFFIEVILIDIIGGTISRLNNAVLKFRGIETRSIDEIKLTKLKKRYEYKIIALKSNHNELKKGTKGIVLELIDNEKALIEFEELEYVLNVPISEIQIKRKNR